MEIRFEPLGEPHREAVVDIYNHYVRNSFAAYPDSPVPYGHFDRFMEMAAGYPAYAMLAGDAVVGFCFLHPFRPLATFRECAEVTYFIDDGYTGKGLGKSALARLEEEGRGMGIKVLLASIASRNEGSLRFHARHGFESCGRFKDIIKKFGNRYDMVWMQKTIG